MKTVSEIRAAVKAALRAVYGDEGNVHFLACLESQISYRICKASGIEPGFTMTKWRR